MTLLMLDGNSLLNRAFYGIKLLSTKDGQFTNGIYGFLTILDKLRAGVHPDGVVAAFDLPVPTFRHKLFEGYKAGRKHMPDELAGQLPILKDLLHTMGCHVVEREGYEADDILGTLARHAPCCVLATGDRDALQLITGEVTVLLASPKETVRYDEAAIREHYGLEPAQLIDLKALMGDASDRIPGVPGIGEKTALELLHQFGTLDALYEQFETSDLREAVKGKLRAGRDSAFVSRTLGTICTDVPIETDCAAYAQRPVDEAALAAALARLEFFKLIEKWGLSGAGVAAAKATPASAAHADADKSIPSSAPSDADLADVDATRVTVPSSSEDAASPPPVASSVPSPAPRHRDTIDIVPVYEDGVLTALEIDGETIPFDDAWRAILCDENKPKRVHDSKTLARALTRLPAQAADSLYGVAMDTMLAAYLCNPLASGYDVPRLLQEYGAADYSALADTLEASLKTTGQWTLLTAVEQPLALVLADMEAAGFEVDSEGIRAFRKTLSARILELEAAVTDAVGYVFNLNSPKQLAKALFEDLHVPPKKKTKSGYSTNADVLEDLRAEWPVVDNLLEYRHVAKLKSTYCDALLEVADDHGRVHTRFNQTETRTGRISSTEPNLQNIPVRQELGRELRRYFRAADGFTLCDADYSQIELRILAAMSGDETMCAAFNNGDDIHAITASQVFDVPLTLVTPLMRSRAKAVNFGIVYGIGAHSLSEDIGVTHFEAKTYIDEYLEHYGAVDAFMQACIAGAKKDGYAVTLFGRRRPLPELRAGNASVRAFGERVARNMPIQGTAADVIKIAMNRVHARLREEGMRARLILQVHDELIVEAPEEEADRAAALLKEEMEAAVELAVKLEVDVHIGKTWYDAKG